jgi:hypothetical protein
MNRATFLILGLLAMSVSTLQAQMQVGSDIDGESAGDHFGTSVSLSAHGDRLAVGGPRHDGAGDGAGHVRVFRWTGMAWIQMGDEIRGEASGDSFGESLSLSSDGNRLAVGAILNDGGGTDSGHARVYQWTGSTWEQMGADIDGEGRDEWAGYVSLSGDGTRMAVGAIDYSYTGFYSGYVRVYEWSGTTWSKLGSTIEGEAREDGFGYALSLSNDGNRIAISGLQNDANGINSGHARILQWSGSNWTQMGEDLDGEAAQDIFGASISLSGDGSRVAIGASQNDDNGANSGHVRVFEWTGSTWRQLGSDLAGEVGNDRQGAAVSLSFDGTILAAGSPLHNGRGEASGQVRIFRWTDNAWQQVGSDIHGEAGGDWSGMPVSLSDDGEWMAIGASRNDGAGTDSGHVRVYSYKPLSNQVALNGLFFDSSNSGHGFDFNFFDEGVIVYYYGHTTEGERLWLISDVYPAEFELEVPFELDMYEVATGTFGSPNMPPDYWGTITITMTECDAGHASINGADGSLEMNFSRLAGLTGLECGWLP